MRRPAPGCRWRAPSRIERGGSAYVLADPTGVPPSAANPLGVPPSVVKLVSSQTGDERLDALDLGWRHQLTPATSIDLAAFYYRYDELRGAALTPPTPVFSPFFYLRIDTQGNNANTADQHGAEASIDWRATPAWRLQAHYAWLQSRVKTAAVPGQLPNDYAGTSPTHQLSLRSSLDLPHAVRWDAWLRHVSPVRLYAIPAYTSLDMRLAWQATRDLELSLVGQNLLEAAHPEYGTNLIRTAPLEVERGAYLQADWKF